MVRLVGGDLGLDDGDKGVGEWLVVGREVVNCREGGDEGGEGGGELGDAGRTQPDLGGGSEKTGNLVVDGPVDREDGGEGEEECDKCEPHFGGG